MYIHLCLFCICSEHDFDSPNSFDYELLFDVLNKLKEGKRVEVPVYDFASHARLKDKTTPIYGANVVIFEGILALYDARVRSLMDLEIFVDTDSDIRLARRLLRDIAERGRDVAGVLKQYHKFVKPAYGPFVLHSHTVGFRLGSLPNFIADLLSSLSNRYLHWTHHPSR